MPEAEPTWPPAAPAKPVPTTEKPKCARKPKTVEVDAARGRLPVGAIAGAIKQAAAQMAGTSLGAGSSGFGLALLLMGRAIAKAQQPAVPVRSAPTGMPSADLLLSLGPYGPLVWGAHLLGKGAKITIQIELSEREREVVARRGTTPEANLPIR